MRWRFLHNRQEDGIGGASHIVFASLLDSTRLSNSLRQSANRMYEERVAGIDEVQDHRRAHNAEAKKSDFHGGILVEGLAAIGFLEAIDVHWIFDQYLELRL